MKLIFKIPAYRTLKLGPHFRAQFYHPEISLWTRDFHIACDTAFRLAVREDWVGFGIVFLGFGFGFDWQKEL